MADSFGTYLKNERELRGASLNDIAHATRIPERHLEALEEDRYDDLPAEVFIKGYIRNYGEALGIDANELLTAYDERIGKGRREEREKSWKEVAHQEQKKTSIQTQLKLVAFLIGMGVVGWLVWASLNNPPSSDSQAVPVPMKTLPKGLKTVPAPEPGPAPSGGQAPPPGMGTESPGAEAPPGPEMNAETGQNKVPQLENGGIMNDLQDQTVPTNQRTVEPSPSDNERAFSLEIRAKEKAWFHMILDEERERDFTLNAGERIVLHANEQILADIGNRNGTEFLLNGKTYELPGTQNVVLNFVFKAELVE
ncbi:RodZ domain-containing protein [Nitrospina watsonii]|nr:RodZ domain-containing protein [Nitrospina watsonii]